MVESTLVYKDKKLSYKISEEAIRIFTEFIKNMAVQRLFRTFFLVCLVLLVAVKHTDSVSRANRPECVVFSYLPKLYSNELAIVLLCVAEMFLPKV